MVCAGMGGTDMCVIALARGTLADRAKEVGSMRWLHFYFYIKKKNHNHKINKILYND